MNGVDRNPKARLAGNMLNWPLARRQIASSTYGVVPKGLSTFLGYFFSNAEFSPCWALRNVSGHLFTWLVCGYFQWRHGLLFTDCIVWDDKDKVIGFQRSHWIHLGWWSTGSPMLQLFQLSQHSHVTDCQLISSSAYFPWNMTLEFKKSIYLKAVSYTHLRAHET